MLFGERDIARTEHSFLRLPALIQERSFGSFRALADHRANVAAKVRYLVASGPTNVRFWAIGDNDRYRPKADISEALTVFVDSCLSARIKPVVVDFYEMALRVAVALVAGALIGYERSYRGRPAGFRTHALVCLASCMLMLVTVYEAYWVKTIGEEARLDPTRMAQGIMTGIGFLGAGVIMQERFSVRGLTTAASIWITAAIGILAGIGFYYPLVIGVIFALGVLSVFRWVEAKMPTQAYYHFDVRLSRTADVSERWIREQVERHGFSLANFTYRLDRHGSIRRYNMTLASSDHSAAGKLAQRLETASEVQEFTIAPTGD